MKILFFVLIGAAVSVAIAVTIAMVSGGPTRIEKVAESGDCDGAVVQDEGGSLSFDTQGEDVDDLSNATYSDVACWLEALDAPTDVTDKMDSTNSVAGMVSAEWDGFEASWTYHTDNGLDLTIVDSRDVS